MADTTPLQIGEYYFQAMDGAFGSYGETLAEITRPGKDSYDFKKIGKRGDTFQINTISSHLTKERAIQAVLDYELLKTTVVNIVKNVDSYRNVLVLDVRSETKQPAVVSDGSTHLVMSMWILKRVSD